MKEHSKKLVRKAAALLEAVGAQRQVVFGRCSAAAVSEMLWGCFFDQSWVF